MERQKREKVASLSAHFFFREELFATVKIFEKVLELFCQDSRI